MGLLHSQLADDFFFPIGVVKGKQAPGIFSKPGISVPSLVGDLIDGVTGNPITTAEEGFFVFKVVESAPQWRSFWIADDFLVRPLGCSGRINEHLPDFRQFCALKPSDCAIDGSAYTLIRVFKAHEEADDPHGFVSAEGG